MDRGDEILRKEKVRIISDILSLYFTVVQPDPKDQYWYGTEFDKLYEKDLTELYVTLAVYRKTKDKTHL